MKYLTVMIMACLLSFTGTGYSYSSEESISIPEVIETVSDSDELLEPAVEESDKWWVDWFRDQNGNKIDDQIDHQAESGQDTFPIFIDYDRRPTPIDLAALADLGVTETFTAQYIDTICAYSVPIEMIHKICQLPNVVLVEIQPELTTFLDVGSPGVRSRGSEDYSPYSAIDAGYSGQDVVIAIIDTGVDDTIHQSLRGKFVGGADLAGVVRLNNTNPNDDFGHGTHTAGIAMGDGGGNGEYIGTAPNASLVDVRISLGIGGDILEGIEWVINNKESKNISIISLSAGTSSGSDGTDALSREANAAVDAGLIFMASAGNDGRNLINAPAAGDKVLAIGATDDHNTITRSDDTIAGFSNFGPRPSDGDDDKIDELKPELVAPGVNIFAPRHNSVDSYIAFSGTSMSCPMVAGVAAMMLEANPQLTPSAVREILLETAESRGTPSNPELSSKFNNKYGFGIVDAYGAVKRAENLGSGTFIGPSEVGRGVENQFKFGFEYTRTEFISDKESVQLELSIPGSWSEPEDIKLDSGSGGSSISSSPVAEEPEKIGNEWRFGYQIANSGSLSDPSSIYSEISFRTSAPENADSNSHYLFQGSVGINDAEGAPAEHEVDIEPMQESIDLVITTSDITFSNTNPVYDEPVVIYAQVNNTGTTDAKNVLVNFTDGPPRTARPIGYDYISNIPGGGSGEAKVTWTATPGVHTIYVSVDPLNEIEETDENNNVAPSQPVIVQGGVNNPPVAQVSYLPRDAAVGQPVTFDGSDSFDTDGEVVLYLFDFGDGENSSWIDHEMTQHIYEALGTYTASLRVEDNGGQKSLPDIIIVNVTEQQGGVAQYYMDYDYSLIDERDLLGSGEETTPIPNSLEGSVIPQWRYVGNWSTGEVLPSMAMEDTATFFAWVQNTGGTPVNLMQLEFTLRVNNMNVTTAASGYVTNLTPGAGAEPVIVTADITPYRIRYNDVLTIQIRSLVNSDNVDLVYGSVERDARVEFHYTIPTLYAPTAEAGDNDEVYVDQEVSFFGQGTDQDGEIVLYQWDYEADGVYDWESADSGSTTYTYRQPGIYTARLLVTDDDALTAFDEREITVNSGAPNQAPTVDLTEPKSDAEVLGTITIKGFAKDEMEVIQVQVSFNNGEWHDITDMDTVGTGTYSWQYEWDTTEYPNGYNTISARSFDGELYSGVETISVVVQNIDMVPEIWSADVKPSSVYADGESIVKITVEVYDDGPYDELTVTINLHAIGGGRTEEMYDDGSHGDKTEDDGEFTYRTTVPTHIEEGEKTLEIFVEDPAGQEVSTELTLDVIAVDIPEINSPPELMSMVTDRTIIPNDGKTEVILQVTVYDENGLDDIETVQVDLSSIGGDKSAKMSDDGVTSGDLSADDGIYTYTAVVATNTEPGEKMLEVLVMDSHFKSDVDYITLVVEKYEPKEEGGGGVNEIFEMLMEPTVLLLIGLIIILVIVGAVIKVLSRGKKKEGRAAQYLQQYQSSMEESQSVQDEQQL